MRERLKTKGKMTVSNFVNQQTKLLLSAILLLTLALPNSFSENKTLKKGKIIKETPVRIDSTILARKLGRVSKNETVEIVNQKYNWYKIRLPIYFTGYVYSSYIEVKNRDAGFVNASNLNIRSKPTLNSDVIGKLNENDKVMIKGKNKEWIKIQAYPYSFGWVHQEYVKPIKTTRNFTSKKDISIMKKKSETKKHVSSKKKPRPKKDPLASGILKKTKDLSNNTVYRLENPNGAIKLKPATSIEQFKKYKNKKVDIWGKLKEETSIYYLIVTDIKLASE